MKHENPFKEAMRYIDNAREILKSAGKDGKYFDDVKYVQTACGTAYLGMLKALDFLFEIKYTTALNNKTFNRFTIVKKINKATKVIAVKIAIVLLLANLSAFSKTFARSAWKSPKSFIVSVFNSLVSTL